MQTDQDGSVLHHLKEPVPEGAEVTVETDWARRYDHMQQHTCASLSAPALLHHRLREQGDSLRQVISCQDVFDPDSAWRRPAPGQRCGRHGVRGGHHLLGAAPEIRLDTCPGQRVCGPRMHLDYPCPNPGMPELQISNGLTVVVMLPTTLARRSPEDC